MATTTPYSASLDNEKFLYKLVIQLLIFCQGSHKLLEPHLLAIGAKLRSGANLQDLLSELQAVSKTLLHISKQAKQDVSAGESDSAALQNNYLLERLDELLADAEVPLRFQQQTSLLKQRVRAKHSEESYKKVIDSAIILLLNIKDYSVSERKGIDGFLGDLSERLDELGQDVETAGQANRASIDNREMLNTEIHRQVGSLKDSTQAAEELDLLKNHTAEHLDRLLEQLIEHKQLEDERQQEAQEKIELMTQKLQELETETETLRVKLKIEHDKALCDSLTGLPNRLAYNNRAEMELKRWKRYRAPLTLIIWDIDFFKSINDTYGHKAGDKTLALVAQLLLNNCRETDFVARYGGEEFVMLMPNTEESQALGMAENTRKMIQSCGFNSNGENINLTLSCGISEYKGGDLHDDVFVRADQALYQSKQGGRNRCTVFEG
ncbi:MULTISPECIES: GGDEF domain-containing protein [Methylomonas]|uniref:diguanylate cyclase n=2 Tax=Methylomonas TaxID=416 RepID=A0A126T3A7_9GAMM|nr:MULTISPECIES: GGDEF domain-containing protein [Methylomonas]AMK76581.1 diguanylate cyclase [Methylomonas denitrificans]OAH97571.1 diguanylate cyclase [Methylomonas methanica]TCV88624.1 diguanylate cyclase [Methylomonas methanica]